MVYLNLTISNPYWWDRWANIKSWAGKPTKNHKCWEVEVMKCEELLCIEFNWTVRQDHAGIRLELGLFGYRINFSWYDTRHWYAEKGRFVDHSNSKDMEEIYGEAWMTGKK